MVMSTWPSAPLLATSLPYDGSMLLGSEHWGDMSTSRWTWPHGDMGGCREPAAPSRLRLLKDIPPPDGPRHAAPRPRSPGLRTKHPALSGTSARPRSAPEDERSVAHQVEPPWSHLKRSRTERCSHVLVAQRRRPVAGAYVESLAGPMPALAPVPVKQPDHLLARPVQVGTQPRQHLRGHARPVRQGAPGPFASVPPARAPGRSPARGRGWRPGRPHCRRQARTCSPTLCGTLPVTGGPCLTIQIPATSTHSIVASRAKNEIGRPRTAARTRR